MKTTVNIFRTLLLAVLTLTFGACGEDSLLSELGLDGQTATKADGAGEVWDGSVAESFAGGSGTAEAPYLIANGAQLKRFASMVNSGQTSINGKLTADILLNDISGWENWGSNAPANSWTPIGSEWDNFTGTLDGDGHSVSGIYINSRTDCQGLVGVLGEGGTLQNLGVKASYIKGGYHVGGVCGSSWGTVTNCYNTGSVTGNDAYVGGLCGMNYATVTNCYNSGTVAGNYYSVGGVCGNSWGTVTNCYNTGNVTGNNQVGGVCGYNDGTVTNCYNTGSVEGSDFVGGVCGENYGNVINCYYLTGTAASGIGEDYNSGEATEKTADQFKSGEVAWLLQGEQAEQVWGQTIVTDNYWGQTIVTDNYPVLDADGTKRVYAVTLYQGSDAADARYLNSNGTFPTLTGNAIALVDADSPFKTGKNIVVKDDNSYTCDNLVLTDGADFYTPVEFTATKATYTRSPKVWATNDGSGSGWETLCLPFSGTLYADDVAKQPVDVASDNGAYWLRSLTGFETPNTLIFASPATAADNQIEAGKPYLIALPGETFSGESLQGQTISVRGTNVAVTNVAQSVQPEGSLFAFTGTFATKACDAASYRLNSENGTSGAGDLFVLDTELTDLAPFRCRKQKKPADSFRQVAEALRKSAESCRQGSEALRKSAESCRQGSEALRKPAESCRQGSEALRKSAESCRQGSEALRRAAESCRQTETNQIHY